MLPKLHTLTLFTTLLLLTYSQTQLFSSTSCYHNCIQCSSTPSHQCSFQSSITQPQRNLNCLPYFQGNNCEKISTGYEKLVSNNLKEWNISTDTCSSSNGDNFTGTQFLNQSKTITANFQVQQNQTQVLLFKIALTGNLSATNDVDTSNSGNLPSANQLSLQDILNPDFQTSTTTTTSAQSSFRLAQFNITVGSVQDTVTLIATKEPISKVQTNCGTFYQFIYALQLPTSSNITNIQISIQNSFAQNRVHLISLQIYGGCSGFTVSAGQNKCNNCLSGFYEIKNTDGSLAGCRKCDSRCKTCTTNGVCTSCESKTVYDENSQRCIYESKYKRTTKYEIVSGSVLQGRQDSFISPIYTKNNSIIVKSNIQSKNSYAIKFLFLYTLSFFTNSNGKQIVIKTSNKQTKISRQTKINITQLQAVSGTYYSEIENGNTKVYIKEIYVDYILQNAENGQNQLTISITTLESSGSTLTSSSFGVSSLQIIYFVCPFMCSNCNINRNSCEGCQSFFDQDSECKYCTNGFFKRKFWRPDQKDQNGALIPSIVKQKPDICVKCQVTCKQCVGDSLNSCKQCFSGFVLKNVVYDYECINCIYDAHKGKKPQKCRRCLNEYPVPVFQRNCKECLDKPRKDITKGSICEECWIKGNLGHGRCTPDPLNGYTFYGTDANSQTIQQINWKSSPKPTDSKINIENFECSSQYSNLWGVKHKNQTINSRGVVEWEEGNFPPHTGLMILFNVFKVDDWEGKQKNEINIQIFSKDNNIHNQTLLLDNRFGSDICSEDGNQMIYSFIGVFPDNRITADSTLKNIRIKVNGSGDGLFIRQLQIYLGNCEVCNQRQLNYEIEFLPRYRNNETQTGLDLFITFTSPIKFTGDPKELESAFQFTIDKVGSQYLNHTQFENDLQLNQRLRYFIPLDKTFIDGVLTVNTTDEQRIFAAQSRRLLLNSRLSNPSSQQLVDRYSNVNLDDRYSMNQIFWFFTIFQWITLVLMIISILCGVGIIVEEFSILLQLIFLHVYISSSLLPATFKAPLLGLQKMENLNYFTYEHAQQIEDTWFSQYQNSSPFVFQQYNVDNYFARSFYPTIIINIVYLLWFLLLLLINKVALKNSESSIVRFIRNIPQRPINYFDQIWRYQFITTMWSAFIQFYSITDETDSQRLNLALCFISFIISILWLFFIPIYTYRMTQIKYATNFLHLYEDIFFKKVSTFGQTNSRYYIYIPIRFGRYLFYALFIALFIHHEIIGPTILIFINIIQIGVVVMLKIYNDLKAAFMKVLENVLFIVLQIMFLFVYGFSNSIGDTDFLNLGYAMIVVIVLMIINGVIRLFYFAYEKGWTFYHNAYGEDLGEKKTYNRTPLPTTQRLQAGSN